MLINLRNALMAGKRTPTAKEYVQTGLVAMWDGIENAGWGVHDASAAVWKDLVGGVNLSLASGRGSFDDNALVMSGAGYAATGSFSDSGLVRTIEICFASMTNSNGRWIEVDSPNIGFFSQYQNGMFYVSATTQPKTAHIPVSSDSTIAVAYNEDFAATVYGGAMLSRRSNGTISSVSTASNRVTLGGRYVNNTSGVALTGRFHAVRLYSCALTASEVAANYAIDKARFGLP